MINRAQKSVEDKERTWGCEEKQAGKMTKWTRWGMWEEEEKDKWREKGQRMAGDDREKKSCMLDDIDDKYVMEG